MSHAVTLAGIAFDPTIRGILVVAVGASVLMGSVWLLVATNVGARVGTLIAFAGFFGWIFIMATVWWMYGIGWQGHPPSWRTLDVNVGCTATSPDPSDCGLKVSAVEKAQFLTSPDQLPSAIDLAKSSSDAAAVKEFASPIDPAKLEGLSDKDKAAASADWDLKNQQTTLSELAAVAPELAKTLDYGKGWRLLTTAQSGEAVASASAEVVKEEYFKDATGFKVLNSFDLGGKVRLNANPNRGDRIVRKLRTISQVFSPPHYVVVQLQAVVPQTAAPGDAPPRPLIDKNSPIISVVMERDLGNKRLYPFLTALGALLLFIVSATMLHYRDKEAMARRAAAGTR
jgi:hypothetical protein